MGGWRIIITPSLRFFFQKRLKTSKRIALPDNQGIKNKKIGVVVFS